jgi:hypothetical protein
MVSAFAEDHKIGWYVQFSCKGGEGKVKVEGVFNQMVTGAYPGFLSVMVEEDGKVSLTNFTEASPIQLGALQAEVKGKAFQKTLIIGTQPETSSKGSLSVARAILQSQDWAYRENNTNQLKETFHMDFLLESVTVGPSSVTGIGTNDFPQTTTSSKQIKKAVLDCTYKAN